MLAFTTKEEEPEAGQPIRVSGEQSSGVRIRPMWEMDLERILELREIVRWSADPNAFGLLRGMSDARWAIAEAPSGNLIGMVGAVPLGEIGILCHLAIHHGYRKAGLGAALSSWAVSYLLSRGCRVVRLDSTRQAEKLYRSLSFISVGHRTSYRLEGGSLEEAVRAVRLREAGLREDEVKVAPLLFGDLPELYGVDRWSFGGDRSAMLMATLKRNPGWGFVARDASGRIKGYLVRSVSEAETRIGPFIASEPELPAPCSSAPSALTATPPSRSPSPTTARPTPSSKSSASPAGWTASGWSWAKPQAQRACKYTVPLRTWLPEVNRADREQPNDPRVVLRLPPATRPGLR